MEAKNLRNSAPSQSPARKAVIPDAADQEPKRTYPCRYCPMTFSTAMALGGHQNGHKKIRASTKKTETPGPQPKPCGYCAQWRTLALEQMASNLKRMGETHQPAPMGFRDFLGVSSAGDATPEASGRRANVINLDDDEADVPELDLDLKL